MSSFIPMTPRRVTLVTIGTRGDVQPHLALAQSLVKRGHTVKIVTESRLKSYVEDLGLTFVELYGDSVEHVANGCRIEANLFYTISRSNKKHPNATQILDSYQNSLVDTDVIVATGHAIYPAYSIAQSKGIAFIPLFLQPMMPTSEFPSLFSQKLLDYLCFFNKKLTHEFLFSSIWAADNKAMGYNEWRKNKLSLDAIGKNGLLDELVKNTQIPILMPCSTLMCGSKLSKPLDYDDRTHVGGFLYVEKEPNVEKSLEDFLSKQEDMLLDRNEEEKDDMFIQSAQQSRPFICIGFGSMPIKNPLSFLQMVSDVCALVQCRVILVAGWSSFSTTQACVEFINAHRDIMFFTESVNHEWLFPKMRCIVHHCGIGTIAAVLRAGVPSIPCPFPLADQQKLAKHLVAHHLAPCDIPFADLNQTNLSNALKLALESSSGAIILESSRLAAIHIQRESKDTIDLFCDIIATVNAEKQWKLQKQHEKSHMQEYQQNQGCGNISEEFHTVLKARKCKHKGKESGRFKLSYRVAQANGVRVNENCMPLVQSHIGSNAPSLNTNRNYVL